MYLCCCAVELSLVGFVVGLFVVVGSSFGYFDGYIVYFAVDWD